MCCCCRKYIHELVQVPEEGLRQGVQRIRLPRAVPYPGYRADLLAVLGNLAHQHRASQDAIVQNGGLELILAQTHFSPKEPVVREWALWTVRNLCTGNPQVQDRVRNLRLQTAVQDEALTGRNQQVELDQLTGKLKLVDLGT
jgi:ataxin-10